MEKPLKVIAWFEEVGKTDIPLAGGKGANLGELTKAQVPVPPGFIVTADAYFYFLEEAKITEKIRHYLENLDRKDSKRLEEVASQIILRIWTVKIARGWKRLLPRLKS